MQICVLSGRTDQLSDSDRSIGQIHRTDLTDTLCGRIHTLVAGRRGVTLAADYGRSSRDLLRQRRESQQARQLVPTEWSHHGVNTDDFSIVVSATPRQGAKAKSTTTGA